MPTANITVAYKNEPKEGWTNWSIKDKSGGYWSLSSELAALVHAGQVVELTYEDKISKAGKPFKMVHFVNGQTGIEPGYKSAAPVQRPEDYHNANYRPAQPPAPAPSQPASGRPLTAEERHARDIYVTGVVGRALGGGQMGEHDIRRLTQIARDTWMEFLRD